MAKLKLLCIVVLIATGCGRTALQAPEDPFDPYITVPGVGDGGQGAGVVVTNFDDNPRPEMVLMAYDERPLPSEPYSPEDNSFKHRILWNLNFSGVATRIGNPRQIKGVGWEGQGAGMAITNLDANIRREMILMAYDNPPGSNTFRYKIGWNFTDTGYAESWQKDFYEVPGVGIEAHGAGMVLTRLPCPQAGCRDDDYKPDMILMAYDAPSGGNRFRYKVGLNLDGFGRSFEWTPDYIEVPGVGRLGQGAGISITNLDENPRPEMVLMAYDNPQGSNTFRGRIGWNLDESGVAESWSEQAVVSGVGKEARGAGIALANLDDNERPDVILMAYDDPPGANTFRYKIGFNADETGFPRGWGKYEIAPGVGREGQGAGTAVVNLDGNPRPELIMMAYDNPPEVNSFRYRVGFNVDPEAKSADWSDQFEIPGVGWEAHGAGLAVTNLDSNTQPELIMMAYDSPPGTNSFRYRVVWNVHSNGVPSGWSQAHYEVPGLGYDGEGAAVGITNLDGNPRPDLIVMAYDAPDGPNRFGYKVGLNLNEDGVAESWSPTGYIPVTGVGDVGLGAGMALVNLDGDPRPDVVLMAYDPTPNDRNTFRYRVGWNLDASGTAESWDPGFQTIPGVGRSAQGADLAFVDLNSDGVMEMILMAYDNPSGGNTFRYKVVPAP